MPTVNPFTNEVGELILDILDPPKITDHVPTPTVGEIAAITVEDEDAQIVMEGPAEETVGNGSTRTDIVELVEGHTPLDIVHWKIFTPGEKLFTVVIGELKVFMFAVPEINDHNPVPTDEAFAAIVAVEVTQIV